MERSYEQFCGVAKALDLLGARWTLLVVRNLLLGPRRYGVLLAELPGITTNLLADRLRRLESVGLAHKVDDDDHVSWSLTPDGHRLEPIVMELGRFGGRLLRAPHKGEHVDVAWGLLSMKRRYRGGFALEVELRITEGGVIARHFSISLLERYLRVHDRAHPSPQAVITLERSTLQAVFFGGADASALIDDGVIHVVGADVDGTGVGHRFFAAFESAPIAGTGGVDPAAVAYAAPATARQA